MMSSEGRVTIVDDMRVNLEILRKRLAPDGYQIFAYTSSREFANNLSNIKTDVFILDVEMPDLNGIELAKLIRKHPAHFDVPILFFTGAESSSILRDAFNAGANDFLQKDVDEIELKLRVRNSVLMHQAQESIKQQSEMLEIYLRLMFHDFATPLAVGQFNLIKGISSLPPGTTIPQLTKASSALTRLVELTTDIRSFFQGTEPNQRVSTKKIIDDINSTFEDKLCERNITLDILNDTPADSMINIPKSFLVHQIVGNFLSNAIKFSPDDGEIELQFSIVRDESMQQKRIRIVIRDFGPGMNEEALSSFTRRRKRTATRGLSGEMGTGSGVMIAQFFLEKFLGTLQIESWCEPNLVEKQGTKVTIFIPESVNKT